MPDPSRDPTGSNPSHGLYRLLLHLLPTEFRREFGEEMLSLFSRRIREAPDRRSRIRSWLEGVRDLLGTAVTARLASWRQGPTHCGPRQRKAPMRSLSQDLRYALRGLVRQPSFALFSILTLGLGIGATTVAFTLVNGILLRPLPFPEPHRLLLLMEQNTGGQELMLSYPNFDDWRSGSRSFQGIAAIQFASEASALGGVEPVRATVVRVSREFFQVMEVPMLAGRPILPEENRPGGRQVAVVTYDFWDRALAGANLSDEPSLTLYGTSWTVVGVLPPGFQVLEHADVYLPMELSPVEIRSAHNYRGIGRLAAGVTQAQAQEDLNLLAARIKEAYGDDSDAAAVAMRPLQREVIGDAEAPILLLFGAAGLLLLIACTNQAGTLLARGTHRQREMAVRTAVGAGRGRLMRQLLTESMLLAVVGGAVGLGLTFGVLRALRSMGADLIPRLTDAAVDPRVLLFAMGATLLTSLLFGLAPAARGSRSVAGVLRSSRHGATRGQSLVWNFLVGGEVAMTVILVAGSALLIRSLEKIISLDTHFDPAGVLTVDLDPSGQGFDTEASRAGLFHDLERELLAVPGVTSVGFVNRLPTDPGTWTGPVLRSPVSDRSDRDEWVAIAGWRVVDENYFTVMGIPLEQGRFFSPLEDLPDGPPVAILNRSLAERAFPGESALNGQVQALWDRREEDLTVVGVVAEARDWRLGEGEQPEIYVYWPQRIEHTGFMTAVLRTNGDPGSIAATARAAIRSVAPGMPLEMRSMEERLGESLRERRFVLSVFGAFTAISLLLAAAGIYGVVSYTVSLRNREIGIRLALGAAPKAIRGRMFAGGLGVVAMGTGVGLAGAMALGGVLQSLLFHVSAHDPLALALAPAVLLAFGAMAVWIPVFRNTRVDPAAAMRWD